MSANNKIKAGEWFERAKHDLESVKLIVNANGYVDTAVVLLQQAVEKYLKGYLIGKGWKLIKTHNLKQLLDEAIKYNSQFGNFHDLAIDLTEYYIEEKYPYSKVLVSLEEVKENYEAVKELLKIIGEE